MAYCCLALPLISLKLSSCQKQLDSTVLRSTASCSVTLSAMPAAIQNPHAAASDPGLQEQ